MLVTGANGFVGRALCAEAVSRGMAVRGITRASGYLPISVEKFAVDGIDGNTDWQDVLTGCEVVVHLAARVLCQPTHSELKGMRILFYYSTF